jgi:type VI secretion system protein ImpJ
MMKRQARVVWTKGMFLVPQLFQAQERFFEDELRFQALLARFEPWGVESLGVDEGALLHRNFSLRSCAGVLDDGSAFSMPGGGPLPEGRGFHELFPASQPYLDVFLALPERRLGERNISYLKGPVLRFTATDEAVTDDLDGQEETIQVARPNFRLLFGGESRDGLATVPIARIQRFKGVYQLDRQFIPPCVNAACATYLWDEVLKSLLDRMIFVSHQLTAERSQRSELIADFADSDIRRFWVLHLVNRAIPELQHIYGIRYCHPEDLYRFLLRFGGALCTFSPEYNPAGFPQYDHRDLSSCLIPVSQQLQRMLETMVYRRRRCRSIPLEVVEPKVHFRTKLLKEYIDKGTFYLAIKKDPAVPVNAVETAIKVVGKTTHKDAQTLAGVQLSQETQAPADCARREGYLHFRILPPSPQTFQRPRSAGSRPPAEHDAQFEARRLEVWQDIVGVNNEEMHLVILNPQAIVAIDLLVVLPELGA